MSAAAEPLASRDLDPMSASAIGTGLAGAASLVWPELVAGTIALAALGSFLLWARALHALRQRRVTHYPAVRLIPLVVLGVTGWGTALLVGLVIPSGGAVVLGVVCVGLWRLARWAPLGF
jgi:hypothetical protein